MTSFAVTLFYGQCWRRRLVGQQIISTITVLVVEVFVNCS